jgi:hypothetical protein
MKSIFISYRREDSIAYAGRLYDRLSAHFGNERLFMDIDTLSPGDDFVAKIRETCRSCEVVLAIIGKSWAEATDNSGCRRLENPNDFVRLEIVAALRSGCRVIPVLLDGAEMPDPTLLPPDLRELASRHAAQISSLRFHADVDRLVQAIEKTFATALDVPAPVTQGEATDANQEKGPCPEKKKKTNTTQPARRQRLASEMLPSEEQLTDPYQHLATLLGKAPHPAPLDGMEESAKLERVNNLARRTGAGLIAMALLVLILVGLYLTNRC